VTVDDQTRWLALAADILNAEDPAEAHDLLMAALQQETRAGLVTQVAFSPHDPDQVAISLDGYLPHPPRELWPGAALMRAHPLTRFHADTRDFAPVLLEDIATAGWDLDGPSREIMVGLGMTEHQLSIPLTSRTDAFEGLVLIAEEAFDPESAQRIEVVQSLLVGLNRHLQLLDRALRRAAAAPSPDAVALTPRERVILGLIRDGHTVVGVAQRLGISPRTVHKHQENLYRKLGAVDRLSAVLAAQRLGILPPDPEPPTPDLSDTPGASPLPG
jgi:DNA-binding CsgD family transcriptional regulator